MHRAGILLICFLLVLQLLSLLLVASSSLVSSPSSDSTKVLLFSARWTLEGHSPGAVWASACVFVCVQACNSW